MRSPAVSRAWHAVLVLVVLASLVTQTVVLLGAGADVNSGESGTSRTTAFVRFVSYFTVQSNLLVLAAAVSLVLDPVRDGRFWRVLRLDALLGITVTGLVFGAVLAPLLHPTGVAWWINAGFHYVSPVMAFLGWLVFGPRPRVDGRTLAWAFVWPLAWIAYTFVRGSVVDWYPYPFLDVDELGFWAALRNTGFVVVLSVLLLTAFRFADRRLPRRG
ncbi:Pr6Pr family membrane protein [Kineococcus rhizosphaerae]|uniref:Pr6Pr family membrane protein n=1 Tax=Kineococcus rhizosphaerae TaxID=559628 RepID=UPI000D06A1C0|nr:Pr6Pr family membrane protein [Kineococcus rhizosphaerae]